MSNRKSPAASELYRERRMSDRERSFERRSARRSKVAQRVAFGGAF
jgi:hypothetical protein